MDTTPFDISTETRSVDGAELAFVRLKGEIDLENAAEFARAIREAAGPGGGVVVDLTGVPFMDSSGLREVLFGWREIGPRLALLIEADSSVARVLSLSEISRRVPSFFSEPDAVRHLTEGDSVGKA